MPGKPGYPLPCNQMQGLVGFTNSGQVGLRAFFAWVRTTAGYPRHATFRNPGDNDLHNWVLKASIFGASPALTSHVWLDQTVPSYISQDLAGVFLWNFFYQAFYSLGLSRLHFSTGSSADACERHCCLEFFKWGDADFKHRIQPLVPVSPINRQPHSDGQTFCVHVSRDKENERTNVPLQICTHHRHLVAIIILQCESYPNFHIKPMYLGWGVFWVAFFFIF